MLIFARKTGLEMVALLVITLTWRNLVTSLFYFSSEKFPKVENY